MGEALPETKRLRVNHEDISVNYYDRRALVLRALRNGPVRTLHVWLSATHVHEWTLTDVVSMLHRLKHEGLVQVREARVEGKAGKARIWSLTKA